MGILDFARGQIRKAVTPNLTAGMVNQGMSGNTWLGPFQPIQPELGYNTTPRSFDYQAGYNIASRPRQGQDQNLVSFWTLRNIIDSYDIAGICISHRIDSIRGLDWGFVPKPELTEDVTEQIMFATKLMQKPDRETQFDSWLWQHLDGMFRYDAAPLERLKNRAGQTIGLRVIDGSTIAPLLDAWGNRPGYDPISGEWAPAFVQYLHGVPAIWLDKRDIIYQPFWPRNDSPYGRPPMETVLLNANSDVRFQVYFMSRFTQGNVPFGLASAPESWTADQILDFQQKWDALMAGDPAKQQSIQWVPGGGSFEWPQPDTFDVNMATWLLKKTAAAFHVTPADIGFTDDVNRATGETQLSVQQRVGDVPVARHLEALFTDFIQNDVGLPLEFRFDLGGEQEDRLATAQSDKVYVDMGAVSPTWVAEERFGITDPEGGTVPRAVMTTAGPLPLAALEAESGPIDQETGAPVPGTVTPAEAPSAPAQPTVGATASAEPVTKAAVDERAAFKRYVTGRRKAGRWRDFDFVHVSKIEAHRLNDQAYATIRKDLGELIAAGLAVRAADTGRVLLLQRALDPTDPASGMWEFPGGHIELGELPYDAAVREWQEEVGVILPDGVRASDWESPNGIYAGFVYEVPDEACVPTRIGTGVILNPDDPDGDCSESIAWFAPSALVGNPLIRAELAADASVVLAALNVSRETSTMENVVAAATDYAEQIAADPDTLELMNQPSSEDDADPLAKGWRDTTPKAPQHLYDVALADYYQPMLNQALIDYVDQIDVGAIIALGIVEPPADDIEKSPAGDAVAEALRKQLMSNGASLDAVNAILKQLYPDGTAAGQHAAGVQLDPHVVSVKGIDQAVIDVNWAEWKPGNAPAAEKLTNGALRTMLDNLNITVKGISDSTLDQVGNILADGIAKVHSVSSLKQAIKSKIGDGSRAMNIAHTESTRAIIGATSDVYKGNGVGQYELLLADGAEEMCEDAAAGNPYDIDDQDGMPPIHNYCRCAMSPVVSSIK